MNVLLAILFILGAAISSCNKAAVVATARNAAADEQTDSSGDVKAKYPVGTLKDGSTVDISSDASIPDTYADLDTVKSFKVTASDSDGNQIPPEDVNGDVTFDIVVGTISDTSNITVIILNADGDELDRLSGDDLTFTINENGKTVVSFGTKYLNATFIITNNTPSSVVAAVPTHTATSIAFTDSDTSNGEIQGTVTITKASDESDITHYVLYWGANTTTAQSATPISTIAKTGSNLTYTFAANTSIPSGATHLLVFSKNATGEMATGVNIAITDVSVPVNAAASVSFTDIDNDANELQGTVTITKATSESDVTHYVLYWGSDASTKQSATPIDTIAVTGANVTSTLAANTALPGGATHLLVYTKNANGEMATATSVAIVDNYGPLNAPVGVSFTDTDSDADQLQGTVTITKAADESDVTHYVLYWGSSTTVKQSVTPIETIAKTGSNVTSTIAANTAIPSGATHLLAFTKNADGEMATGVSVAITDVAIPTNAATSVSFTDNDTTSGEIQGTVTITKAADESDVTHYVLYWGSNTTTKQSGTPIDTIAVTGSNVTSTIAADTAIPGGATHLLVFTKNADGEMATGVNVAITDVAVPTNASAGVSFTDSDTDSGEIQGTVTITKAADESDVTHYVLYWGSSTTVKQSATPIDTIAVTGSNVTHTFAANTAIPSGVTHLLVFTKNANGEMPTGVNTTLTDVSEPTNPAGGVSFTDSDPTIGEIQGDVTITKATDESDVTHYVLYWGSSTTVKQSATPIDTIAVTGSNVTHTFSADTAIPSGATHLLVFTKNAGGEMSTGVNIEITEMLGPKLYSENVSFTDYDYDSAEIWGTVRIQRAINETDIVSYVLYWGSDAFTKNSSTPITTISKTGTNLSYTFSESTSIPAGATHLLVYAKTSEAEADRPVATKISDAQGDAKLRIETNEFNREADSTPRLVVAGGNNGDSISLYYGAACDTLIQNKTKSGTVVSFDVTLSGVGSYTFSTKNITSGTCSSNTVSYTYASFVTISSIYSNKKAFAAIRSDGSVITWGDSSYGGDSSTVASDIDGTINVTAIYNTDDAFAALRTDGSVITWGNSSDGGDSSSVSSELDGTIDVTAIYPTNRAFAALRTDGSVVTWGYSSMGGDSSSVSAAIDGTIDVTNIYATKSTTQTYAAYAALRSDGSVITWGYATAGGDSSSVSTALDGTVDVVSIASTRFAFAALHTDGSVTTWGYTASNFGADSTGVASAIDGTNDTVDVTAITGSDYAFAALRADGSVITWGDSSYGGDSTSVASAIDGTTDVSSIVSNGMAFAAIRADGSVVTWGDSSYGGNSTSVASDLDGTTDVTAIYNNNGAFAALRIDGSVITWGYSNMGGDSSSVSSDLDGTTDVTTIYSGNTISGATFAALRTDGSVVTWGNSTYGGDSSDVSSYLDGTTDVTSIKSTQGSFAALRTDGSVITWGDPGYGNIKINNLASSLDGTTPISEVYANKKIIGTSYLTGSSAFAALRTDGSLLTWGMSSLYAGNSSGVSSSLDGTTDVVNVYGNDKSLSALRSDGSLITWGSSSDGGNSSSVSSSLDGTIDVAAVYYNEKAAAAIRSDGSVVTWGYSTYGGDSSSVASSLDGTIDVKEIRSTLRSFAALRTDGSVVTWGYGAYGGDSSSVASSLDGTIDVIALYSSSKAFAALRADGSVVTWGSSSDGGDSSSVASSLNGTIKVTDIYSASGSISNSSFAALRADGSVITWGYASYGGDSSSVAADLDGTIDVKKIFSTITAFAALRVDGSVITWGNSSAGGDISSVSSDLNGTIDVIDIVASHQSFAALRADGSVITWGSSSYGGDSSSVSSELNGTIDVTKIYSNDGAFAALRADGSVVTWGYGVYGGDSSSVSTSLNAGVVNITAARQSFCAYTESGSAVSWGELTGFSPAPLMP